MARDEWLNSNEVQFDTNQAPNQRLARELTIFTDHKCYRRVHIENKRWSVSRETLHPTE